MQFPDDATLIARGKYSTLGRERREELSFIRQRASHLMTLCQRAMNGVQAEQADMEAIADMYADIEALNDCGKRAVALAKQMSELKEEAWG